MIALLIPSFHRGGAERVVSRLSRWFVDHGHRVAVVTWDGRDPAYDFAGDIYDLRLPPVPLPLKLWRQWQRARALRQLILDLKPTQVLGFMEAASVPLVSAALKLPAMMRPHVTVSIRNAPSSFTGILRWQMMRWYPYADRVVVMTEAARHALITAWKFPLRTCTVIANPLDASVFASPAGWIPAGQRQSAAMAVGRHTEQKGFDLLLQAWSRHATDVKAQLIIYGAGPLCNDLATLAQRLGMHDQVKFVGTTTDIIAAYDRARVFVLSSRHEGFPNVLAEAMARGCACVAFDCPTGPAEMIEHERTGLLVPAGDVDALGRAIRRVLLDTDLATRLGEAARQRALDWHIDRIAPQWLVDPATERRP